MDNEIEVPPDLQLDVRRKKHFLFLLSSIAFVVLGFWMIGRGLWEGWLSVGSCGFGGLVFAILLIPGSSNLRIDADGLTVRSLYREFRIGYSDVQRFFPYDVMPGGLFGRPRLVGMTMNVQTKAHKFSRSFAGADGGLPDTYGLSADELSEMLNERLDAWRRRNMLVPPVIADVTDEKD